MCLLFDSHYNEHSADLIYLRKLMKYTKVKQPE